MKPKRAIARARAQVRQATRFGRGKLAARTDGFTVGRRVQIGSRCRIFVEPGAELVLGDHVEIDDGVTIAVSGGGLVELAQGVFVGHHATIAAQERITIGARTYLAELVSVRDHDHDPDTAPSAGIYKRAPVCVGEDVWLASKVTVTRGVNIGDRSVVGANSVVVRSLPSDVIAVGAPAHVLRAKRLPASGSSVQGLT